MKIAALYANKVHKIHIPSDSTDNSGVQKIKKKNVQNGPPQ